MPSSEPPLYRPFALLAFAASVFVGVPIGVRVLLALHAGAPAVAVPWLLLHAHVQIVGFFATLIVGVAPHLMARFSGRPLAATRWASGGAALLAIALALRIAGTAAHVAGALALAAALQALFFTAFVAHVWRTLDPPPLAPVRRHLTLSSAWIALVLVLETALRLEAAWTGTAGPTPGLLRALHAAALLGGVLGWVLGVLLRAGPMFVPGWAPPRPLAAAVPWLLAAAAVFAAAGEAIVPAPAAALMVRLGEGIALATAATVVLGGGALRRARTALPLLSRGAAEARIFRLAAVSALAAVASGAVALVAATTGTPVPLLGDAVRHLLTVGVLGAIVIAMGFRLVVVLEAAPLPWPRLRDVAFAALAASVVLRTAQVVLPHGAGGLAPLVVVSGVLAWVAFASVAVTLVAVAARRRPRS